MKKIILKIIILLSILNVGCASRSKSTSSRGLFWDLFSEEVTYQDLVPEWAKSLDVACKKEEICAIGADANSLDMAEKRAIANLAKIFENQIQTEFNSSLENSNNQISESAEESILENTNILLEGAEKTKSECIEDDKNRRECFVLAKIQKSKLSNLIRKDLEEIDQKIKAELNKESLGSISKAEKLILKRFPLERRLKFLGASYFNSPISLEDLAQKKQERLNSISLKIVSEAKVDDNFLTLFEESLTSNGFKVSSGSNAIFTHKVVVSYINQKEYLKVKGFEKYSFKFNIRVFNKNNENLSTVQMGYSESGRSLEQIKEKVYQMFKEELEEKISELNIQ